MRSPDSCASESSIVTGRDGVHAQAKIEDVTVVVVSYNSARHLPALARAFRAGTSVPARMLVVDNASTDDTLACATIAGFEVFPRASNDGFGAACNTGLELASTEFVLFCNPDVRPGPLSLALLVDAIASQPMVAIAGAAGGRRFSRISRDVAGFLPKWLPYRWRAGTSKPSSTYDASEVTVDYSVGAFILCRVSALRAVDGFDERFFLYCEEEDLSRRLLTQRWQTILVPSADVSHEHGGSSRGVGTNATAPLRLHSRYLYYRKHHSRPYAELARCVVAVCVLLDRAYRALLRRPQLYPAATTLAPFRDVEMVRRAVGLEAQHPTAAAETEYA